MILSAVVSGAIILDWLTGEPKRFHPLVGFGSVAGKLESSLNSGSPRWRKSKGLVALLILAVPLPLLWYIYQPYSWSWLGDLLLLWFSVGHRSLYDHIQPIATALDTGDQEMARTLTSRVVSRDKETLNIEVSAVESTLENGNDAVFAALFWFVLLGGAGALFYRFVNTLDAMWGYRNLRFNDFGRFTAQLDDLLNLVPARLTALSFALLGHTRQALGCWQKQAHLLASPNGGPVMTSGAGALGVLLGGATRYQGQWQDKPYFGAGEPPVTQDIRHALRLVSKTLALWVVILWCTEGFVWLQA